MQIEVYIETGQIEERFTALDEALAIRRKHGDRFWEADLYRLKGELLLVQANSNQESKSRRHSAKVESQAEASFQQAIETGRELNAKSLELRATTSLARLWQQQDKQHEAHRMLSEIYNWFTEGFDTKDLQKAKALLEKLSHRVIGPLRD
jgi:predicted ATPase